MVWVLRVLVEVATLWLEFLVLLELVGGEELLIDVDPAWVLVPVVDDVDDVVIEVVLRC